MCIHIMTGRDARRHRRLIGETRLQRRTKERPYSGVYARRGDSIVKEWPTRHETIIVLVKTRELLVGVAD